MSESTKTRISVYDVKSILDLASAHVESSLYKSKKRIPIASIKPILESKLDTYAQYNGMTKDYVADLIIKYMSDYHRKKTLPKTDFIDELEFELNNFHHNKMFLKTQNP